MDDDFLKDDYVEPPSDGISPPGGNLLSPQDLKPKEMPKSIMAVYQQLGGDSWLLKQAQLYPKEFLSMIKAILPKNIDLSIDQEVFVSIAGAHATKPIGVVDGTLKVIGSNRHNGHPGQIEELDS